MNSEREKADILFNYGLPLQFCCHLIQFYTVLSLRTATLKVLGKSVGLCKTSKRKDQLYISLLVSVWRIICENFNPNGLILHCS